MTTIAELVIGADPERWRAAGFDVAGDGVAQVGGVRLRFVDGRPGVQAWVLAGLSSALSTIDGLPTSAGESSIVYGEEHPNSALSIDHIVVNTPDLERTCDAIAAATGAPVKRVREAGAIRQGFHRLGEVIVEVVTHPGITGDRAEFWGLALNVVDIDGLHERLGDELMSPPKDAVQSGRRIASFRRPAELGLPVAVMTPLR